MLRSPAVAAATVIVASSVLAPSAHAEQAPPMPDLVKLLSGYEALWKPSSTPLHGEVTGAAALARNDEIISWINMHATSAQQTRALRDAMYRTASGKKYDQSMTIADGLGQTLGDLYLEGRRTGKLPLTEALLSSSDGTAGDVLDTGKAKGHFSYPRPFLRATAGDHSACTKENADASSLAANRSGRAWADSKGNLTIKRVAPQTDSTHRYVDEDTRIDTNYSGICLSGSFPSGHTANAYEAGITLATLVPEAAPTVLARASEAGNNRIVLGVHYPFDVIGGRMSAQAGIAALWADDAFRTGTLEPARKELRDYLTASCTQKLGVKTLAECVAKDRPYVDDPYAGAVMPGGSAQKVSDRASALAVYTERLSYGIGLKVTAAEGASASGAASSAATASGAASSTASASGSGLGVVDTGNAGMSPSDVPAAAASLLRTTYPSLSDAQRREVLAQTAQAAGNPLAVGDGAGWQRLNLAAAMSATVRLDGDSAHVMSTGGSATVDGKAASSSSSSASSATSRDATGSATSAPAEKASSSGLSTPAWVGIGVAAVAAIGGAAAFLRSRRR